MTALRPYQLALVERLRAAFRAGKRAPLLQLATGGGKTYCFCFIARSAVERGNRVCILVHRQELLSQTSRALGSLGVVHGIIAPGHAATDDPVQVASVQTIIRRIEKGEARATDFSLIVIDEAHHAIAGSWRKVIAAMPKAKLLGVTATPCRMDGKGLIAVFDELVAGPPITELVEMGFLVPAKVFAPPVIADFKGVRTTGGDYRASDLAEAMDNPTITGNAVEHYRRICPGVPAIAFCASIEHSKHVAAEFSAAGFRAASIDGHMPDIERKALIQALGDGQIQVLTSCDIVSEGTDIPVVGAAILLRPTKSESLFLQQVGRALRTSPGKEFAIVLDHAGNVLRHGMPDEAREWNLADGVVKRKRDAALGPAVAQCPKCYAMHRPTPMCPSCGFVYKIQAREIEIVHGNLTEIDAAAATAMRDQRREQGKAQTIDDLVRVGKARGMKNPFGWARHVMKARESREAAYG